MCISPSGCSLAIVRVGSPSPQVQHVCFCPSPVWELSRRDISSLLLLLPVSYMLLSFPFLTLGISISSLASESNFSPLFLTDSLRRQSQHKDSVYGWFIWDLRKQMRFSACTWRGNSPLHQHSQGQQICKIEKGEVGGRRDQFKLVSPSCIMSLPLAPRPMLCVTATIFFAAGFLFYYMQDHSFGSPRQAYKGKMVLAMRKRNASPKRPGNRR